MSDSHTVIVPVKRAGLANLGAPDLEDQFQDHMARIAETFDEATEEGAINPFGGDVVTAKVTVTYTFKCRVATKAVDVTSSAKVTLPNRRSVSSPLMLRGGKLLIEENMQEPLNLTSRRSS